MARYIDEKFIRAAMFHPLPYTHITPSDVDAESFKRGWNDGLEAVLENAESADVVEVVRCEKCYYAKPFNEVWFQPIRESLWCSVFMQEREPDYFCKTGERRTDAEHCD